MEFIESPLNYAFIKQMFATDREFYEQTYVCETHTLDECVEDCVKKLSGSEENGQETKFFMIKNNNEWMGFYAINDFEGVFLRTFFIKPNFRHLKTEFINKLKHEYKTFKAAIYTNNKKAIGYFNREGGEIIGFYGKGLIFKF